MTKRLDAFEISVQQQLQEMRGMLATLVEVSARRRVFPDPMRHPFIAGAHTLKPALVAVMKQRPPSTDSAVGTGKTPRPDTAPTTVYNSIKTKHITV